MLGKDFFVFWQIGQAILAGSPLYSVPESLYPPATLLFFSPLGLLPFSVAFSLWSAINVLLYYVSLRKLTQAKPLMWFLYTPALFVLLTGQIDIIFLWLATFLHSEITWKKVTAAILLTLKPQIAFIVLPWHLLRWVKQQPRFLISWLLGCTVLHILPLSLNVNIYSKWLDATRSYSQNRMLLSPGIFTLTNFSIPLWILIVLAAILIFVGLIKSEAISKTMQILALPMGIWYEDIFLVGLASWKWLIPISWAAFIAAFLAKSSVPFLIIPLFVLIYRWWLEKKMPEPEINSANTP